MKVRISFVFTHALARAHAHAREHAHERSARTLIHTHTHTQVAFHTTLLPDTTLSPAMQLRLSYLSRIPFRAIMLVARHTSRVTCSTSHVTRHTLHITTAPPTTTTCSMATPWGWGGGLHLVQTPRAPSTIVPPVFYCDNNQSPNVLYSCPKSSPSVLL